jgi:hypothetical protein
MSDVTEINVPTRNSPAGSAGTEQTTTNFRNSRLTWKLHISSPELESLTLHMFRGEEDETRSYLKNRNLYF